METANRGPKWYRVQVWGKLAEYAAAFKKGPHVCVEGELRSREQRRQDAHL
jgi:single-stranded DNA-binding protein